MECSPGVLLPYCLVQQSALPRGLLIIVNSGRDSSPEPSVESSIQSNQFGKEIWDGGLAEGRGCLLELLIPKFTKFSGLENEPREKMMPILPCWRDSNVFMYL